MPLPSFPTATHELMLTQPTLERRLVNVPGLNVVEVLQLLPFHVSASVWLPLSLL